MNNDHVLVCLHKGTSIVGQLIRWQTRGEYSHASIILPSGEHIEAREGKGVLRHPRFTITGNETVDIFKVHVGAEGVRKMTEFLHAQVGKGYDWTMVARFISRRQETRASSEKWFCSELVFAALLVAGVVLLRATQPWEVSPALLGRAPALNVFALNIRSHESSPLDLPAFPGSFGVPVH